MHSNIKAYLQDTKLTIYICLTPVKQILNNNYILTYYLSVKLYFVVSTNFAVSRWLNFRT